MYELEDSAYHLNPSDRIWDLNEDGTLKTNDSNIEIFDLCLGKDGLLNYVTGNKEFLKNPNVVNSYINHLINKQTASFKVNKLWSKIYSEVGSDFFDNLWINISKDKTIDDIGNKFNPGLLGSLKYSTIGDNKIEVKELVTFMLSSHKDLPKILLSKEVIFDNKFLKVAGFFSHGDWYKKIPAEYYRHPNAMSILELLNYGDIREKDLLSSIPKEILITPKNILNVLKKSTNKLEALKVISLELYDYCAINNINEEQVTEKIEIIFNAMIIDKIALTNKAQSKKNFKF